MVVKGRRDLWREMWNGGYRGIRMEGVNTGYKSEYQSKSKKVQCVV